MPRKECPYVSSMETELDSDADISAVTMRVKYETPSATIEGYETVNVTFRWFDDGVELSSYLPDVHRSPDLPTLVESLVFAERMLHEHFEDHLETTDTPVADELAQGIESASPSAATTLWSREYVHRGSE